MIDETIIKRLFCQHYSEMFHLARTLLYDEEEAEDVVQDVFVRLVEADIFPAEDKIKVYLLTAVRNGCINCIRRKSITEQVKSLYFVELETDTQNTDYRLETLDAIRDYADKYLTEPRSTIFCLRFEEGMTLKEIAQQLDMNLKTVFKYLSQSIQLIQQHFRH